MAAGQRAYMVHQREQRRHDHEIEMACMYDDESERADFIRLAVEDEMQQVQEHYEQEVYYEMMESGRAQPISSESSSGAVGFLPGIAGVSPQRM